ALPVHRAPPRTVNSTGASPTRRSSDPTTALTSLTTNAGGSASLRNVTTTGTQSYNDTTVTLNGTYTTTNSAFSTSAASAVTLAETARVTACSGAASFGSTVDGARTLTV